MLQSVLQVGLQNKAWCNRQKYDQAKCILGWALPGHVKFIIFSIILSQKTFKFQSIKNQQNYTFDQCQIKLGFIETVSEIVLYIVQEFL